MAEIKAIDGKSVHQICSGQVILDLSIALKELVENSLDAGATSIEVKLKENGLESVEVSDNGRGVEEKNFAALRGETALAEMMPDFTGAFEHIISGCLSWWKPIMFLHHSGSRGKSTLKHHTSKLKDFTDLESVETFGFRGEALSSLCALCDVTICTRHANSSVGHRLEYDHDGKVTSQATVARPPGTTVTLKNLFKTLPVRFKELKKNIKKEYSRLLTLLNAYCIISTDVKITCSNQSGKSRHGIIVATQLESSMDRNVAAVFGSKQLHSLIPFRQLTPSDEVCEDYNLNREEALRTSQMYTIRGLISDPIHGNGRSVPDRQFYYINSRPVELPRLARLINEVYHIHNRHQFPFVVLDVITSRDKVDINVTPDKRQVFVHNEKVLLSVVKTSLMEMYEQRGGNVVASIGKPPLQDFFQSSTQSRDASELHPTDITEEKEGPKSPDSVSLKSVNSTPKTVNSTPKTRLDGKPSPLSLHNLAQYRSPACPSKATESCHKRRSCAQLLGATVAKQPRMDAFVSRAINNDSEPIRLNDDEPNCVENVQIIISTSDDETLTVEVSSRDDLNQSQDVPPDYPSSPLPSIEVDGPEFDSPRKHTHQSQVVQVSMERLKRWSEMTGGRESTTYDNISSFHAQIDPRQNTSAEKELTRHLSKESFLDMRPLGQFNLGFVIARLGNDLFIIDQHASDEIYNFETLQRSTEIHSLKLVVPQRLQLDPAAHSVLTDNMSVFRKNGFDFDVKPEPESGKEIIHMTRVPVSKNWDFGSHDVDELIFMLSDAPHVMCRPSRIRQMFASRACRKSIMIGTALTCREMSRLVKHMSEINHPWNCPHGRPTMRHLIDLSKIT